MSVVREGCIHLLKERSQNLPGGITGVLVVDVPGVGPTVDTLVAVAGNMVAGNMTDLAEMWVKGGKIFRHLMAISCQT